MLAWTKRSLALGLTCLLGGVAAQAADLSCPAVFGLNVEDARGRLLRSATAFAIDDRHVATSAHALAGAARISVFDENFSVWRVRAIVEQNDGEDYALLVLRGSLPVQQATPPRWAMANDKQELAVLAFAPERGFVWSPGHVNGSMAWLFGEAFEISATLTPGMSGAPVVNADCHVIGMASFGVEGGRHAYFARPIKALAQSTQTSKGALP